MKYTIDDLLNDLEKDVVLAHPKEHIIMESHKLMERGCLFEITLTREGCDGLRLVPIDQERIMVGVFNGFQDALGGRYFGKRKEGRRLKSIAEKYQFKIINI